ncbi:MAG: MAPEG family protein, partial [Alphaproteobacteria bacterium]
LVVACLVLAIGALARHRFLTPADIDGSGLVAGSDRARILQAIVQNTLEQAVIAIVAHLVWAAAMPPAWQAVVPAAAILFVFGRIAFAIGYAGGAPARAFGFALTFYPTVFMLVASGVALILRAGS